MYAIEDFLTNCKSFLEDQTFDRFLEELEKVVDYHEKFEELVITNPEWLESAEKTLDENGNFHIFFLLTALKDDYEHTELRLRNFCNGKQPTLKLEIYGPRGRFIRG